MDLGHIIYAFVEYHFNSILIAIVVVICFTLYCNHKNYEAELQNESRRYNATLRHCNDISTPSSSILWGIYSWKGPADKDDHNRALTSMGRTAAIKY